MRTTRPVTPSAAMQRLESLCARSEQCTSELRARLARMGIGSDDAARIIDSLHDRRFVDDARYAAAYVRDKYRFARWGRRKIAAGLAAKHISRDIISSALDTGIDADEYEMILRDAMRARARSIAEGNTYEGRTRLYRFAAQRGFESELIARIIRTDSALWPDSGSI